MYLMVVTKEDNVEAWYLAGYSSCGILLIIGGDDAAILTTMKQTEDQIGLLVLLDIFHPLAGTTNHLFELNTFPYRLVQPVGNGWGEHADHTDLHSVLYMNRVGLQTSIDAHGISLTALTFLFHDIGT